MIYQHPFLPDGGVIIEQDVWNVISSFIQQTPTATEAGGILLGYRRGVHLHAVNATVPQPGDRRAISRFERKDPYHQQYALEQWELSCGLVDYLGEWHTHPEAEPTPSPLDLNEWKKICSKKTTPMLFIIAGTTEYWIGMGNSKSPILRATLIENLNNLANLISQDYNDLL